VKTLYKNNNSFPEGIKLLTKIVKIYEKNFTEMRKWWKDSLLLWVSLRTDCFLFIILRNA